VTAPVFSEHVAAVRGEGEQILAAAGQGGLDVPVPTCGDWTMRDLLVHVGSVYHRAGTVVGERATAPVAWQQPADDIEDPVGHLSDALDELIHALSDADADTPVWNWSGDDQVAGFWARRMAHESAVHRYDAQRAHGVAQPIDDDLAYDGMDELVDVILPRIVTRDELTLPSQSYTFSALDDGAWHVALDEAGVHRLDALKDPDVVVRATASGLLLGAYARVPWTSLDVEGDDQALARWTDTFKF
jgi:uncharacterized protein (TIGR03083 family)